MAIIEWGRVSVAYWSFLSLSQNKENIIYSQSADTSIPPTILSYLFLEKQEKNLVKGLHSRFGDIDNSTIFRRRKLHEKIVDWVYA